MRKFYLILALCSAITLNAQLAGKTAVTFKVDMSQVTVSPNGVHLYGSMQGYDPNATLMTNTTAAMYEVTLSLDTGVIFYYRFVNGNTLGDLEDPPTPCDSGIAGNREFESNSGPTQTIGPYCYASCDPCPAQNYNVTFQVDMSQQSISGNGVHIAASWNGFSPSATTMTHQGSGVYTHTESLTENTAIEYIFVNGNTTGNFETVPIACNVNGHRSLNVPNSDVTLPEVCFSSCSDCLVGIGDPVQHDLVITPSVADAFITIQTDGACGVSLIDATGRSCLQMTLHHSGPIDVSALPAGLYTVVVREDGACRAGRVLVQ